MQHRTFDRAVLGPPDSRRGDGRRGAGEPGDGRVTRVLPLAADHHHHGDDRQDETRDPGHHLGRGRQPARDVMQPGRDIVGQFRAAERKSPDIAEHHRDDRQREHREQQVRRAAHPAGTVRHPAGTVRHPAGAARRASRGHPAGRGLLHAGIGPAGRLIPSARHHDIRLPGVTSSTPPRRPPITPDMPVVCAKPGRAAGRLRPAVQARRNRNADLDEQPLLQRTDTRTQAIATGHLHPNRDHPHPGRGLSPDDDDAGLEGGVHGFCQTK